MIILFALLAVFCFGVLLGAVIMALGFAWEEEHPSR